MGAPNFEPMNYDMPLICGRTYGQMYSDLADDGEEVTNEDIFFYEDKLFEDAEDLAENMNGMLTFHKITVIGGRYDSFQFQVEEIYSGMFDLDRDSRDCIDNEDAHYYFDMCRSQALLAADAEKRKIRKWLNNLTTIGFNKVECSNFFSNGEAEYTIVKHGRIA